MNQFIAKTLPACALLLSLSSHIYATSTTNAGVDFKQFDSSVSAQDDFYTHVNGLWLKNTPIPADKSSYGTFTQLDDDVKLILRQLIQDTAKNTNWPDASDEQKLADFYNGFLDESDIEKLGFTPLKTQLGLIEAIKNPDQLAELFSELNLIGVTTPFAWYVNNDWKKSTQYATFLVQSGLGMPDRDYYLKDEEKYKNFRQAYQKYIADLLAKAGFKNTSSIAAHILTLETRIATAHWDRVKNRDVEKTYNKFSNAKLNQLLGSLNWKKYAQTAGLNTSHVIVRQPTYIEEFSNIFQSTDLKTWKHYLAFHLLDSYAPLLSAQYVQLHFDFHKKTLRGTEQQEARWKRAVESTGEVLGEVLGKLYVKENFTPAAKKKMMALVDNLILAYEAGIQNLEWMSAETKQSALKKLAKFQPKIGYPDKWKDYSELQIKRDDLVGNMMRYGIWEHREMSNRLGKPIDRSIWHMTPQTINAYYNPVMNEIVFPAAILQPPYFDLNADGAVNYGGIGAIIGHEISHGFDDQGAKFDGDGNLNNWWTEQDSQEFKKRGEKLIAQYNQYKPFPDAQVNGALTLGENIGDFGGVTIAYQAYQLSLGGKKAAMIENTTGDERFFYGWSQAWRRNYREDELRNRLITDPHSPSKYRANGILSNMPEFYSTFQVKAGDGMYRSPETRVKIW